MSERAKQMITLVATFAGVLGPAFGTFSPGDSNTGEISGRFFSDVYIIPSDYAFAIWAPIYLGFLAFAVFQALPTQRLNPRFTRVRLWLAATALLKANWIHLEKNNLNTLSLVIIVAMLVLALVMPRLLEIGKTKVYGGEGFLRLPFSLYAGWLTAATILNTAGVLAVNDWGGFGISYPVWGVIMLVVATTVGLSARFRWNDPVYGAVFVWALVGVALREGQPLVVVVTAWVLALVFMLSLFPGVRSALRSSPPATA